MSTGLMSSCVRENTPTPPLDSEMQAEISTMSLPSEYSEPQKRRRFNALKNLRRIFRRRTVASAETLPSKGKIRSHIVPVELADSHFRDSFSAYKQPSLVSIRSTNEERQLDCNSSRNYNCNIDYDRGLGGGGHRGGSGGREGGPAAAAAAATNSRARQVEDYTFDECRRRDRQRQKTSLYVSQIVDRSSVQRKNHYEAGSSTGDWTNGAHKRSHSEDRLKEGVPIDQEISKSHESVFRESRDMAMLTIGLKTELIDVLRKRRSRPDDSYENNLEATPSPKRSSAEMYDLRNTLPHRKMVDPDVQLRLAAGVVDVPDLAPMNHSHIRMSYMSDFKDQDVPSPEGLLSHSAARHKMAIRPKKKGPTRFRRSADATSFDAAQDIAVATVDNSETNLVSNQNASVVDKSKTVDTNEHVKFDNNVARSPATNSRSYFEGVKPLPRTQTKSEECLQEAEKETLKYRLCNEEVNVAKTAFGTATTSPCINKIAGGRRKSVEKSQSFKIFSHAPTHEPLDNSVSDRKDLYNMNRPVSYREFSSTGRGFESPKPAIRSSLVESRIIGSKPTVDTILPIVKANNIVQIEENIDKLVSSNFVPLMKKATSHDESNKAKVNNVSITTIRPETDVQKNDIAAEQRPVALEDEKPMNRSPGVALRRRSSSNMEKSPSVGSLNTLPSADCKVPEFLRIHLNRVENTRPKSSIVLYKGTGSDTLPRRHSREDSTKPPLPPALNVSTLKRPSINKSQETITESNHVIIVPVSPSRKPSIELCSPTVESSVSETVTNTPKPVAIPAESRNISAVKTDIVPVEKLKENFSDRKGSVSEEKAKIERRLSIADEKTIIRKKSIPNPQSAGNKEGNKEDNTPELMKVFARRSMKLRDDDDDVVVQKSDSQSSVVTDSDKENQSSSREELLPKSKAIVVEEIVATEVKAKTDDAPYRARTFLEVKHMLQSTNGSNNTPSAKPAAISLRTQKNGIVTTTPGETMRKEAVGIAATTRNNLTSVSTSETDKLPEFKRILERRAEWESRAKMCK